MVKQISGEINKILTFSILVFVVVSLTSELVSGSSSLTSNSAPSLYSGKYSIPQSNSSRYFVSSPNPSNSYIRIIDLINVSAKLSVSILHILELHIPGSGNGPIPTAYLMGSFVPSSYLDKNSVPISGMTYDRMRESVQPSDSAIDYISPSGYSKGFSTLSNSGERSVKLSNKSSNKRLHKNRSRI